LLDGRQQERDQDGDDGDHHQQFNEGKTPSANAMKLRRFGHGAFLGQKEKEKQTRN
jgi:hypothetical protein